MKLAVSEGFLASKTRNRTARAAIVGLFVVAAACNEPASDLTVTTTPTTPTAAPTAAPTTTNPTSSPSGWTRIDGLAQIDRGDRPVQLVSDGSSFFALFAQGDDPSGMSTVFELVRSDDGTAWATVASVPFSHINSVRDGKVLASEVDGTSLTIYIVDDTGAVERHDVPLAIQDQHRPFVMPIEATVAYLGDGRLIIEGSYQLSPEAVLAAGLGVPVDEILAVRSDLFDPGAFGGPEAFEGTIARALGLTSSQYRQMNFQVGYGADVITMDPIDGSDPIVVPLGDLHLGPGNWGFPPPIRAISVDGFSWEHLQVGYGTRTEAAIEGALVGWTVPLGSSGPSISFDGIVWNPVIDAVTGAPLPPEGDLRAGPNRVVYIANSTPRAFWDITKQGALPIEAAGTALESLGTGRQLDTLLDGDGASMTFGDAGAAYLTGFRAGAQCPCSPTQLVTSTDDRTWVRETLPFEMMGEGIPALAVGAQGVILIVENTLSPTPAVWYRKLDER
jgi:hypothetical protein